MNSFSTYQSFFSQEQLVIFTDTLNENNIPFIIETDKEILDATIIGTNPDRKIHLKLNPSDFTKADSLFKEIVTQNLADLPEDYYLFQFSDEELKEILMKPDEWSKQDEVIARKILSDRGINFSDDELASVKKDRLNTLAEPQKGLNIWVILGYISSLLGGFFGIFLGYALMRTKKLLPDGSKVFLFDEKSRRHGEFIFYFGILMFIITIVANFLNLFNWPF